MDGTLSTMDGRRQNVDGIAPADATEKPWRAGGAASYLGVSIQTLYRWNVEHFGPPHFKIRGQLRYWPSEVREWARSQERSGDGAA